MSTHEPRHPGPDLSQELELALGMADAADAITMSRFGSASLKVQTKPDHTPVTDADTSTEQALRLTLGQERPGDAILGEEYGSSDPTNPRQWILDPIDGTKNYLRGVPVWASLIALVVDGVPAVGVVSAPALGRRWWAALGLGAWSRAFGADPHQLHASAVPDLSQASLSYSDAIGWREQSLDALLAGTARQRAYGDFWSHMLVAEGAVDIAAEPELGTWDMAALIPIIREAGGMVTAFDGGDPLAAGSLVATNGLLHAQVLELLHS